MARRPRVSVGLPVYNGAAYLSEAVEALLGQTLGDFELVLSDNASTDDTEKVCRDFAADDRRVRYVRAERNRGAAWNHNRTFELATAPLFKWAAADDACHPEFLQRCVERLDADPSAVLAHPRTVDVDAGGNVLRQHAYHLRTDAASPHVRFGELARSFHDCFQIYGVMRRDVLRRTPLIGAYTSSDRVLLAELSLYGRIVEVPQYLFLHREHRERSMNRHPNRRARAAWFDPDNAHRLIFPSWRVGAEYLRAIGRVPLPTTERARCLAQVALWSRANWEPLARDIPPAARCARARLRRARADVRSA